jgi:hypothetical protein
MLVLSLFEVINLTPSSLGLKTGILVCPLKAPDVDTVLEGASTAIRKIKTPGDHVESVAAAINTLG